MRTATQILNKSQVYTAAMCADADDARNSLEFLYENCSTEELELPAVLRRIIALRKVLAKFEPEAFEAEVAQVLAPEYVKITVAEMHPLAKYNGRVVEVFSREDMGIISVLADVYAGGYFLTPLEYDPAAAPVGAEFIDVPFTPSEALYDRNSKMPCTEELSERCHFCQRPIRPTGLQVHMTTDLELTTAEDCENSQGYFEVGPECAKKIPKRFLFKNIIGSEL